MSRPIDSYSDGDATDFSYTDSVRTYDTLDDLLSRFTLEFRPEYVFKVRNRFGPLVIGADIAHSPGHSDTQGALVLKPTNTNQWWRRLRIDTTGGITLRSRKLRWWVFTLDLSGGVNAIHRTTDASFRVATKWDLSRGEYHNKKKIALGDATEGRVHWSVNYNLPELTGSLGAAQDGNVSRDVHAEIGYAHAEVAKVELVVWPWRNNPKKTIGYGDRSVDDDDDVDGSIIISNNNSTVVDRQAGSNKVNKNNSNDTKTKSDEGVVQSEARDWFGYLQQHIKELKDSFQGSSTSNK